MVSLPCVASQADRDAMRLRRRAGASHKTFDIVILSQSLVVGQRDLKVEDESSSWRRTRRIEASSLIASVSEWRRPPRMNSSPFERERHERTIDRV